MPYHPRSSPVKWIQMTISLSGMPHDGLQTHTLFPLYILLARPDSNFAVGEYSAVFRFSRACILNTFTGVEGMNRAQANFILPEINKLAAEVKSGSLALLFVSCAEVTNSVCAIDPTQNHKDMTSFPSNVEGYCLLGKIPMELLYLSWEKSPNLSLGERAEMMSTVDMHSCFMKTRNARGLVAPAIAAGLGTLTHTLGTLVPVIGASGFATAAATTAIETVVGSFR